MEIVETKGWWTEEYDIEANKKALKDLEDRVNRRVNDKFNKESWISLKDLHNIFLEEAGVE